MTIKRFLLMLLVMLMSVTGAWAQMSFISEVKISAESDGSTNKQRLKDDGYTVIDQDLNAHEGGRDIYIGYKTTTNPAEAITGLLIVESSSDVDVRENKYKTTPITYRDKPYYRCDSYGSDYVDCDLNRKSGGADITLYYTKWGNTTHEENLVTELTAVGEDNTLPYGYYVNHWKYGTDNETTGNTNEGNGSYKIYLLCKFHFPNVTATFNWAADGNTCTADFSCDCGMTSTNVQCTITTNYHPAPTCTTDGQKTCTAKRYWFRKYRTGTKDFVVSKLGHDMVHHARVEATPTQDGHYEYWTCSRACCDGNILYKDAEGTEIYSEYPAIPSPHSFTLTLDKQGGTGGDDQVTFDEGAELPTIAIPARDGFAFVGYFSGQNGTGEKYYNFDGASARLWNRTENITLYAYWTDQLVPYIDADGTTKYAGIDGTITNTTTTLSSGLYLVTDVVQTGTIVCEGNVHIILADGAKLTANGGFHDAGIRVSGEGASLTIYGQQNQTGQLIAKGDVTAAGIGGGEGGSGHDITINGGVITATGGNGGAGIGGGDRGSGHDITINGGVITATGGYNGAGIGGGGPGAGHDITINGGVIIATGGSRSGESIGGGEASSSSNIFVNSSLALYADSNNPPTTVIEHTSVEDISGKLSGKQHAIVREPTLGITVTFDKQGGIGGDDQVTVDEVAAMPTITVPAINDYTFVGYFSGQDGAGIKYYNSDGTSAHQWNLAENTTLYAYWEHNCVVTLDTQGGNGGTSQITANYDAPMPTITVPTRDDYIFNGYYTGQNGTGTKYYKADGTSARLWNIKENNITLYACWNKPQSYVDVDGTTKYLSLYETINNATTTLTADWYVVSGEDVQTSTLVCEGEVHLILADGAKLTATGDIYEAGIRVSAEGASLFIYGQTEQTGQLIANGGRFAAGIGGSFRSDGHDITINGGVITANGGSGSAGIGGGQQGEGGGHDITINGGVISATGGYGGAGIGSGSVVDGGGHDITINGGVITATGVSGGAGIGGGAYSDGHDITINGGVITAIGAEDASAIGGGEEGGSSNIFVNSSLALYADDDNNPPTTLIGHTSDEDISGKLLDKRYAIVRKAVKNLTVTFDKQDGTGGDDQVTVDEGAVMPTISVPTRDGYIFWGYYTGKNGTGTKYYNIYGTSEHLWDILENNTTLYAYWNTPESYIDADGSLRYVEIDGEIISTNATTTLSTGWYIVLGENVQTKTIVCEGEVHLILADGAKLTATGDNYEAGIRVSAEGASLFIYGQTEQTGQLIAKGDYQGAGIGGGRNAAGHDITINGGKITPIGGMYAPALGGGNGGSSSNIFVNSSLALYADDDNNTPATLIGHTSDEDISGKLSGKRYAIVRKAVKNITVTFDKQEGTDGDDQVTVDEGAVMPTITVPALPGYKFKGYYADENGTGTKYYNEDGTSAHLWDHTENTTLHAHWKELAAYIDADGTEKIVEDFDEITNTSGLLTAGWYKVKGADVRTGMLVCEGEVHLILADGAKLTANCGYYDAGIRVSAEGASLTIYGQQNQTGQLIAKGDNEAAGIGGGEGGSGHHITINGGVITATGGSGGAGIGGGNWCHDGGHDITINGGVITATGGFGGAGIGGGNIGDGHHITINGGVITATAGYNGAGIGGGGPGAGHDITINGGVIIATGGSRSGEGIGGGEGSSSSNIYVEAAVILNADENATPTTEIEHTSSEDLASALNGKRYATIALPSVKVNHAPELDANFSTFYHKYADYTVPNEDATIYTAAVEDYQGETCLVLREIEGGVIPANTAVIVRTEESTTIDLQPCADASDITVPANSLSGANLPMDAPDFCYILSYGQHGLGFYKYAEGNALAAHKAYLTYQHGSAQARALRMVFADDNEVDGIESINDDDTLRYDDDNIYSISGVRLNKLQKGINIVNGKKVFIK